MNQQFDPTNRGIFGRNERKTQDTHPDFTGSLNVNGQEFWLDGYKQTRKDGSGSFISLRVKPKEAPAAPARRPAAQEDDFAF
jgi:hypothetical protein